MAETTDILVEQRGTATWITINRPERRNALRRLTVEELTAAFGRAEADPETKVIVLTGAGDRAFCSGGDFSEDHDADLGAAGVDLSRRLLALSIVMRGCGKPVIARVNGWAVAAGNELQIVCDFAFARDDAKFRQGGPNVGSVPAWWGTQLLPLMIGDRRAREAIMLARTYSAAEAEAIGLITKAVPPDELDRAVEECCESLASMSEVALRYTKSFLNANSNQFSGALLSAYDHLFTIHSEQESTDRLRAAITSSGAGSVTRPSPTRE